MTTAVNDDQDRPKGLFASIREAFSRSVFGNSVMNDTQINEEGNMSQLVKGQDEEKKGDESKDEGGDSGGK